jgi:hypothetical protein
MTLRLVSSQPSAQAPVERLDTITIRRVGKIITVTHNGELCSLPEAVATVAMIARANLVEELQGNCIAVTVPFRLASAPWPAPGIPGECPDAPHLGGA